MSCAEINAEGSLLLRIAAWRKGMVIAMDKTVLQAVLDLEWDMFSTVNGPDKQVDCQQDRATFDIMRRAQAEVWTQPLLESWEADLRAAKAAGRNLMMEKYAHIMQYTEPSTYEEIRGVLPMPSDRAKELAHAIAAQYTLWAERERERYPMVSLAGRPISSDEDMYTIPSSESYMRGELYTYSEHTLELYWTYLQECVCMQRNLHHEIMTNTVKAYGYASLEDAEEEMKKQAATQTSFMIGDSCSGCCSL